MVKVGDWVKFLDGNRINFGTIEEIHRLSDSPIYGIRVLRVNDNSVSIFRYTKANEHGLEVLPIEYNKNILIDLALETKDEKWFKELVGA